MTDSLNVNNAFDGIEAELLEAPLGVSLTGPTNSYTAAFHELEEQELYTGYWRCEPGKSEWNFVDNTEVIYIISGRMTVTENGGEAKEFGPGDSVAFPKGWQGVWEIHETLTKFYTIFYW
ncbi:MAG: DUF861 domain-containing protein [Microbacteriaceae bacterium]|nr:DUF861 domain-containing protein [Microbacteriaceae bacterium]